MKFTSNYDDVKDFEVYIVTVPTPIDGGYEPDLNPIKESTENLSKIISKNNIIIYESTVYPGLTEEFAVPILEKEVDLNLTKIFIVDIVLKEINPETKNIQ